MKNHPLSEFLSVISVFGLSVEAAVIAAGAVVHKDVAPFSIVGGVPIRKIGNRKEKYLPKVCSE
jgi:serine acetyltransferase